MNNIKIICPAKINLTLEVLNKRDDGFHNIRSIMQTINLCDYLDINVEHAESNTILLSGDSKEIPYNESNLVYKAADLFLKESGIKNIKIQIYIKKNIPVSAGLAGGSTDGAGTLYGLNKIFNKFSDVKIETMCASLGSDLNVCLKGGCSLAESRGEIISPLPSVDSDVTLIKPRNLGISAGFAYKKYSQNPVKHNINYTKLMTENLNQGFIDKRYLYNDLELAVFDEFKELHTIKNALPDSVMTGSGSTYFILDKIDKSPLDSDFLFINGLKFIKTGVEVLK